MTGWNKLVCLPLEGLSGLVQSLQVRSVGASFKGRLLALCTKITPDREPLLKGKAQYYWPPCIASFDQLIFYKTSYLNEEVNCTKPFPSVSVPCPRPERTAGDKHASLFGPFKYYNGKSFGNTPHHHLRFWSSYSRVLTMPVDMMKQREML